MTRITSFLIAVNFLLSQATGQSVYLRYDDACMDRLEYSSSEMQGAYVSYSLKLSDNSFMVLDIGKEDGKWQKDLPGKLTYCSALKFDRDLVRQINAGTLKLFIVRENPTQYQVTAVDKANFFAQKGNAIQFMMEDAEFMLYTDNLVSQVNLATPNSQKEVYLEGTIKMQCLTGYVLQKKDGMRSTNFKEYVFYPGLGIVEKSSGSGPSYSSLDGAGRSGVLRLNKFGNVSLQEAVSMTCDQLQASYYDRNSQDVFASKTGGIPTSYNNDPCAPSSIKGIHIVQKGETMYGISRRYGISLDQLRNWNKLQSDVISICQNLYVQEPSATSASTTTTTSTATSSSTVLSEKAGADGYYMNAPEVYVVRLGDTVAGLASMFGYTEERFRKMNALSPTERIFAGQKLRTNDCVCPTLESTTKDKPLPYETETPRLTSEGNPDVYFRPIKIHQVKKEETLFSIAKLYDTSVERILELNGMKKGDRISPEQRIYVQ